jgi:hypothetical protein
MTKQCKRCRCNFKPNSNAQKFCSDCAYIVNLDKARKSAQKKRQKTNGTFGADPIKKNGKINFEAEHRAIKRELIRIGLRKNYA